jgi:hypothetical protein
MTGRQLNQILWITVGSLLGGAVIVVVVGLLLPIAGEIPAKSTHLSPADKRATVVTQASLPSLESFEPIWNKSLRRALVEVYSTSAPPSIPVGPVVARPGALPMTLVGTIGNSLAMLQNPDGSVVIKGVGDQLAGAEVRAIRTGQVDLRYNGQMLTLNKTKEPPPFQGVAGNPNNQ